MITYVLYPGYIRSQTDGDRHYVGVADLKRLYHISADARVIVVDSAHPVYPYREIPEDAIHCRPRFDGKYPIFEESP